MTTTDYMVYGTLAGILVGLWPLIKGVKADQLALGIAGFFASALSGAVLGLILSVPIAWLFAWAIKKRMNPERIETEINESNQS